MRLADPEYLLFLIPLAWLVRMYARGRYAPATLRYSDLTIASNLRATRRVKLHALPFWLRVLALTLIIIAAARPQYGLTSKEVISKGIDIIVCLDRSESMLGIDPSPGRTTVDPEDTRLNVAKQVIRDFVQGRRNDRLGLVVFAGRAFTQCPLTLDYGILLTFLDTINIAERDPRTAIGDAIGTAVNHLKNSGAKSRVIILVTDGESNTGLIDPFTAANLAKEFNIKIYTVGVGSKHGAVRQVKDFFGSHLVPIGYGLDEATLREVARTTGARYFPAGDPEAMKDIFLKIDQMEKTEIKLVSYTEYSERFLPWAALAFGFLIFEIFMRTAYLRSIP